MLSNPLCWREVTRLLKAVAMHAVSFQPSSILEL